MIAKVIAYIVIVLVWVWWTFWAVNTGYTVYKKRNIDVKTTLKVFYRTLFSNPYEKLLKLIHEKKDVTVKRRLYIQNRQTNKS